jgi:hypothetical protein
MHQPSMTKREPTDFQRFEDENPLFRHPPRWSRTRYVLVAIAFGAGFGASAIGNATVQTVGVAVALCAFATVWLRFFYTFVYSLASPRAARAATSAAAFGILGLAYSSSLDDRILLYGAMLFAFLMLGRFFVRFIVDVLGSWRR